MARRSKFEATEWEKKQVEEICPLCGRDIPEDQREAHHLIPKSKGGKVTEHLHRICHQQIHALFKDSELAKTYSTVAAILENPEMQTYVEWVKTKPVGFMAEPKRSNRRS